MNAPKIASAGRTNRYPAFVRRKSREPRRPGRAGREPGCVFCDSPGARATVSATRAVKLDQVAERLTTAKQSDNCLENFEHL